MLIWFSFIPNCSSRGFGLMTANYWRGCMKFIAIHYILSQQWLPWTEAF